MAQQQQDQPGVATAPVPPGHAAQSHPSWLPNVHVLCGEISLPGSRYGSLNQDYVVRGAWLPGQRPA